MNSSLNHSHWGKSISALSIELGIWVAEESGHALRTKYRNSRKSPHHETHGFHIRKAVEHIQTAKQVKKIVDPVLRQRMIW